MNFDSYKINEYLNCVTLFHAKCRRKRALLEPPVSVSVFENVSVSVSVCVSIAVFIGVALASTVTVGSPDAHPHPLSFETRYCYLIYFLLFGIFHFVQGFHSFKNEEEICRRLQVLAAIGLDVRE